jgi:hypothetical protein
MEGVTQYLNGKVTIIVMMKTIIQDVNMMEEIAVVIMSTHNTALHVNVWNNNFDLQHWLLNLYHFAKQNTFG